MVKTTPRDQATLNNNDCHPDQGESLPCLPKTCPERSEAGGRQLPLTAITSETVG